MERLVHIGLWVCDIVLEAVRHRAEHIVDKSENIVTFCNSCDDDTYSILVVDLVDVLVSDENFAVDTVNALYSAVDLRRLSEILGLEAFGNALLDDFDKGFTFFLLIFENTLDLVVSIGVKIMESKILKFLLDSSDTETVSDRSVDIHSLQSDISLLVHWTVAESTHIMETVGKLDNHYTDILRHGKEYLSDIFCGLLLFGRCRYLAEFCNTVNKQCNVLTKSFFQVIEGGIGILYNVMEQGSTDGIGIHAEFKEDVCNCKGMDDIILT